MIRREEQMSPRTTFPSSTDLAFYQCKQRLPRWAQPLLKRSETASIDLCVNAHAGIRSSAGEMAAHNLLAILRSMQRRRAANLAAELYKIADAPGCAIDPAKRAALARKWADRLAQDGTG
jgi:hypothetical protein